jgi:hypothetical protein
VKLVWMQQRVWVKRGQMELSRRETRRNGRPSLTHKY